MNNAIANFLNQILGNWVQNLNSDQLNLSIFSGIVKLQNLKLKSDVFREKGFPFNLEYSSIGEIHIKIPWSAWYSSPLVIKITNVFLYLTPLRPESWDEAIEKAMILKNKNFLLDKFEVMNSDEDISSEGMLKSLVTKVIDNVELTIENLYIRYEDSISSIEPFAIGLVLRQARMQTCNEIWESEFRVSKTEWFKLLQIENLYLFIDYNNGAVSFRKFYNKDLEDSVLSLINDEFNNLTNHKFILSPFFARIEAIQNKNLEDHCSPKISLNISTYELNVQLYIMHLKLLIKLSNFINLYYKFNQSVYSSIFHKNFSFEQGNLYEKNYRKLRNELRKHKINSENLGKIEKLKVKLGILEESIPVFDIISRRKVVLMNLKLETINL